jgi:hypothetical protein
MHPHGVKYTPENEGVFNKYSAGLNGSAVAPNTTFTYKVHTGWHYCTVQSHYSYSMDKTVRKQGMHFARAYLGSTVFHTSSNACKTYTYIHCINFVV